MRTHFTEAQRADPDFATSEHILRRCVHCGFCTATCPTYMLLGDELDSPRGRIYLIKEMLEGDAVPAAETVKHIDRCLSCLSCVTACPAGVDYMHLIDHARDHIERRFQRPLGQRMIRKFLGTVLSRPQMLAPAMTAARGLRVLLAALPSRLRTALPATLTALLASTPEQRPAKAAHASTREFASHGPRRGRVALLQGCAQSVLAPSINEAAIRLLTRHGIEVVIATDSGCCGALNHHLGQATRSHALARQNVQAWMHEINGAGLDAIVTTTSGCGTMIKDYAHLFRAANPDLAAAAARVSMLTRDVSEYLGSIGLEPAGNAEPLRVAYQSPCSMHHGQNIRELPKQLLTDAGFQVQTLDEEHVCCGSAGTYNLLQPVIAERLRSRKQALIAAAQPDVVATGNVGCMMQLAQGFSIPIVHTVELLDWACGGPRPQRLPATPRNDRSS